MDSTNHWSSEREMQRVQASREELVERLTRAIRDDGTVEPLPGLRLRRASAPTGLGHGVSFPSLCVIGQGSKELLLGDSRYRYNPAQYLISTAALPIASRVVEASSEHPYLGIVLKLDSTLVGAVLVEAGHRVPRNATAVTAIDVSPLDASLLDAVVRLIRLLDSAAEVRFLAPLIMREIVYRLMLGAQGGRLHQIAALGGVTHRIAEAVERLRNDFDQPLRIEDLAQELGMSVSGFHHHFRSLTAMSPLQFQKQLRLQEARRLMLCEGLDATSAGYRVGYGNASHFTVSTSGSSALRRCTTWSSCAKVPENVWWVKEWCRNQYLVVSDYPYWESSRCVRNDRPIRNRCGLRNGQAGSHQNVDAALASPARRSSRPLCGVVGWVGRPGAGAERF